MASISPEAPRGGIRYPSLSTQISAILGLPGDHRLPLDDANFQSRGNAHLYDNIPEIGKAATISSLIFSGSTAKLCIPKSSYFGEHFRFGQALQTGDL